MKKRLTRVLAVAVSTMLLLSACGGVVTNEPASNTQQAASTESSAGGGTEEATTSGGGDETSQPARPLDGASVVLKIGYSGNDTSMLRDTWNCYARVFKKSLELYSGGEMTLECYPNDQLGGTTSVLEQCSQGTVDIALSAAVGSLAGWVPNVSIFDMPYLVDDIDVCNLVCQGEIFEEISSELESAANMKLLSMIQTDFRNIDSWTAPIRTVEDLKGLKMRVQELDPHIAMVESWDAVPAVVAFSELYSAAQTGVIDCYENCNYTLFMNNLYETVNYITETKHAANVCICAISTKTWEALTPEQQDIMVRATYDARRATCGVVSANNVNNVNTLEGSGIEIISLSDSERQAFADACFDGGKAAVMSKIDADFYDRFMAAYEEAARIMGRN